MPGIIGGDLLHGNMGAGGGDAISVTGAQINWSTDAWEVLVEGDLERCDGVQMNWSTDVWEVEDEDDLVLSRGVEWDSNDDGWASSVKGIDD